MENIFVQVIHRSDRKVFGFVNQGLKCKFLDFIMPCITHMGSAVFTIAVSLAAALPAIYRYEYKGLELIISLLFSHIIVYVVKRLVKRARPYAAMSGVNIFKEMICRYSFPSGHTTAVFSLATACSLIAPGISLIVFAIAVMVGLSRIYIGVHYPTDVAIGAIIGCLAAWNIHLLFQNLLVIY